MAYIKYLLLSLLVSLACSVCVQKSCPIGKFCSNKDNCDGNTDLCVELCATKNQQGNWSSGNCEQGMQTLMFYMILNFPNYLELHIHD